MITRDPASASHDSYDLIVVGAGIHGVISTLEAARSGLRVLLIERDDFGGATTWNSLRILHGGLRYLQGLDLPRFRESVQSRSWFVDELPDLVEPLPCLMPLYDRGTRRRLLLGPAIRANETLRRRWSSPAELALIPAGQLLTAPEVVREFEAVRGEGLQGGALWYDGCLPRPQRVLIELLARAVAHGAVALNYVESRGWIVQNGRIIGVQAADRSSGARLELSGRAVLNCAGPWAAELAGGADLLFASRHAPSVAFNLLLDRALDSRCCVAVEPAGGGRTYFLRPMGGRTLAGTFHAPLELDAGGPAGAIPEPTSAQIHEFLADLRSALPGFDAGITEIRRIMAGVLPAVGRGTVDLASRDVLSVAAAGGGYSGMFSLVGVKYTTAPAAARRAITAVRNWLAAGKAGAGHASLAASPVVEPRKVPDLPAFLELCMHDPEAAGRLLDGMIREESVQSVSDLVLRRTDWGLDPSDAERAEAAVRRLRPELGGTPS